MHEEPSADQRQPALEIRALTKSFEDRVVVDHVDLRLDPGSVYGLLGRNGAGKTTLLRMILGLLTPDSGSVYVLGHAALAGNTVARRPMAGFVEEPRFYPYLSARRNLDLLARLDGPDTSRTGRSSQEALELVDLADRSRDKVGTFSTGMRQRLGLAAALLRRPRLLILDEPTIGLDPAHAAEVRAVLTRLAADSVAVLVSSNNMAEVAEICDRIQIIHHGRGVWDGTRAQLNDAAPAPAWQVRTSNDASATEIAQDLGLRIQDGHTGAGVGGAPLVIRAEEAARDNLILRLAAAGIAARRIEPDVPPLEALFTTLTADPTAAPTQDDRQESVA